MPPASVSDIHWQGKIALVRADLNTPLQQHNGKIQVANHARIRAVVPTLKTIAQSGGKIIIISHLGRPNGKHIPNLSLAPVAHTLQNLLQHPIDFSHSHPSHSHPTPSHPHPVRAADSAPAADSASAHADFAARPLFRMLENIRFHPGEKENSPELAKQLAQMGDVFVMDAFACAHRAEASVCALANAANEKCIGPLVMKEINALNRILKNAPRPLVGIFGGAKIADKIPIIQNLAQHMDAALIGGGAANALIRAHAGQSIDLPADAEKILKLKNIHLPQDAVAARNPDDESGARNCSPSDLAADEMILDIGEKTRQHFAQLIHSARAIVWNGPMGVFEKNAFANGTRFVAEAVAESSAFSLAGGGETVAALERFGVAGKISHVSTGGGALLEYLAGRRLPGLAAVGAQ